MWRAVLLFLLFVFLARAVWRLARGVIQGASTGGASGSATPSVKMARDPICGTFVVPGKALSLVAAQGETIYFCSEKCRSEFGTSSGRRA